MDRGALFKVKMLEMQNGLPSYNFEHCHSTFTWCKVLLSCIADAVEGAQQAYKDGILHRDLSAGNIMIVKDKETQECGGHSNRLGYVPTVEEAWRRTTFWTYRHLGIYFG
ncbi:hypothetical protein BYT27DRAFT_7133745, partial [Phlegmacium glaucopus]